MSAPATPNLDTAHRHLFAQFNEVFGSQICANRPLRLRLLSEITGHPISTTTGWTEEQYRWTARRLRRLAECPDSAAELLREAVVEVAPAVDPATLDAACRVDLSPAETVEQALALMERAAEVGHQLFYSLGDAALILLAAAPGARKKDVLSEHIREMEHLKPILCPDPSADSDPVAQLLILSRVSARIPTELRDAYADVPFGYHKAAALTLMTKNGLRVPPDLQEVERRLSAVSDGECIFRKPADLREWIAAGSKTTADGSPERPDYAAEAFERFADALAATDPCDHRAAFAATFGPGAPYRIVKARGCKR